MKLKHAAALFYPECGAMRTYSGYDGAEAIYFLFTSCFISDKDK